MKPFKPVDIAIIAVFAAMWAVLNLTIGPLGFTLFQLPIFCDFSVYFTLLLAVWVSGRIGTSSAIGVIGALIVLAIRPSATQMIGFMASAILFDVLMTLCKHEIRLKPYNMAIACAATIISAYFAGIIIGTIFMKMSLEWALTFWGIWHLIGGAIGFMVAVPVIVSLERTGVRGIKGV
ncbi:MAG: hypothetical protein QXK93_01285 [Candidatus Bathyarchaeia archaeon]|nr:hypothetical protein [Candidatus Bathyarchaeota archaeon]